MNALGRFASLLLVVSLALAVAPKFPDWGAASDVVSAVFSSLLGLSLAVAAEDAMSLRRSRFGAVGGGLALVALMVIGWVGLVRSVVPIQMGALAWLGAWVGGGVGRRIQDPGHLLAATAVLVGADILSVFSPSGPTHALLENDRAMSSLVLSGPVFGTDAITFSLGVGDLVVATLYTSAARPIGARVRVGVAAALAVLGALGLAAASGRAIPALVVIGPAVILAVPAFRTVRKADRTLTLVGVGFALSALAWLALR